MVFVILFFYFILFLFTNPCKYLLTYLLTLLFLLGHIFLFSNNILILYWNGYWIFCYNRCNLIWLPDWHDWLTVTHLGTRPGRTRQSVRHCSYGVCARLGTARYTHPGIILSPVYRVTWGSWCSSSNMKFRMCRKGFEQDS